MAVTAPPHAARDRATEARVAVRDLVGRFALPVEVVIVGRELEPELQAVVDRVPVAHVLGWVPHISTKRAGQIMASAGLDPHSTVRLGDLPAGVRARLATADTDRRRQAKREKDRRRRRSTS
jgi:hypothetical protein